MPTKVCSTCRRERDLSEFRVTGKGYVISPCRKCHAKYMRKWRKKSPCYNPSHSKEANKRWYLTRKNEYESWKSKFSCSRCPENHPACIEFHHRDPATKEFNIGFAWRSGISMDRIMKEVENVTYFALIAIEKSIGSKKYVLAVGCSGIPVTMIYQKDVCS